MLVPNQLQPADRSDVISNKIEVPEFLYGDSSRLKQVLIMLTSIALKGVHNTKLSIAVSYEAGSQLLFIKMDDPLGHIYAKL